jgi:hypothetical protein
MSDQPVAKVSTYTGQHNTERRRHSWLKRNLKPRTQRSRDQDLRPRPRSHWDRQYKLLMTIIRLTAWYSYQYNYYSYPTTRQEGAWGERRYSSYLLSTSALDGGEWSASCPSRALAPGKDPGYSLYRRLGGPQNRSGHRGYRKNPFASAGNRNSIARSSYHYNL